MIEKQRDLLLECISYHNSILSGELPYRNHVFVENQYFGIFAHQRLFALSNSDIGWLKIYSYDYILLVDSVVPGYKFGRKQINDIIQYLNSTIGLDGTQIQLTHGRDPFGMNFLDDYVDGLLEFMKNLK